MLFSEVSLGAYPFKLYVKPAIEIGLEVAVDDKQRHHMKHTLLKTTPHTITVDLKSAIPILIDNNVQVSLTRAFFDRVNCLAKLTDELKHRKKSGKNLIDQGKEWLKLILANSDPVTAVFESSQATIDTKKLKALSLEDAAFNDAEGFWDRHIKRDDFAESWGQYERLNQETTNALEEFPDLLLLWQTLQKKDKN